MAIYLLNTHTHTALQLGLGLLYLRLLQHRLQLGRLHDVALDLELAAHKQPLRICLAQHQLAKLLVGKRQRDISLLALWRRAFANSSRLLEIEIPLLFLASLVLEVEGEDGTAGFDRVLTVGVGRRERAGDLVEGGRGGEVVWGAC